MTSIRKNFCPNLHFMYQEYSFIDRFKAAADDGFRYVEFCFAYNHALETVSKALHDNGQTLVSFNFPSGDLVPGKLRGLAGLPGCEKMFDEQIKLGLQWAEALNCKLAIAPLACIVPENQNAEQCFGTYISNLSRAAEQAASADLTLLVEANNNVEHPGYLLTYMDQCRQVVESIASPNVRMLMDTYHTQMMEGDLTSNFVEHHQFVQHIQVGNLPGRHEPDYGEINHHFLFSRFDEYNYQGWIAGEYYPLGDTSAGLGWLDDWDRNN